MADAHRCNRGGRELLSWENGRNDSEGEEKGDTLNTIWRKICFNFKENAESKTMKRR
jgi:hypothetical protein